VVTETVQGTHKTHFLITQICRGKNFVLITFLFGRAMTWVASRCLITAEARVRF
jgi:hypothetical protein